MQELQRAEAGLAVARASVVEATAADEIAKRGLRRAQSMHTREVVSDTILDAAIAKELASRAKLEVSKSNVTRARAAVETARIRLGYAQVTADWSGGEDTRYVGVRYVDDGSVVAANTPLLSVVELDPIVAVVTVPERDYASLAAGQRASLRSDAHRGRSFEGKILRIAPVFDAATRQARVELRFDNREALLKPGMFVRATLELARIGDAITIPFDAVTKRNGVAGVFVVADSGTHVSWRPVELGVRDGALVQALRGLEGSAEGSRVVTLGQALCDEGTKVVLPTAGDEANKPKGEG